MRCALRYFRVGLVHTWDAPLARLQQAFRAPRSPSTRLAMHKSGDAQFNGTIKETTTPPKKCSLRLMAGQSFGWFDRSVGVPVDRSAGGAVGRRCRRSVAQVGGR